MKKNNVLKCNQKNEVLELSQKDIRRVLTEINPNELDLDKDTKSILSRIQFDTILLRERVSQILIEYFLHD